MKACGIEGAHIFLEPAARNTAPAIALAVRYCIDELGASNDEVIFITPADHIIRPIEAFCKAVLLAADMAPKGRIVTFGIKPTKPETGFGYIQAGIAWEEGYV